MRLPAGEEPGAVTPAAGADGARIERAPTRRAQAFLRVHSLRADLTFFDPIRSRSCP